MKVQEELGNTGAFGADGTAPSFRYGGNLSGVTCDRETPEANDEED